MVLLNVVFERLRSYEYEIKENANELDVKYISKAESILER